uniref:Uncharacterized protein n=1 Tax=Timema monikensis TaxID=170555 RepID=A0A7R9EIC0_9NEOP|nr:unnamed protein product [Timema monikensis]
MAGFISANYTKSVTNDQKRWYLGQLNYLQTTAMTKGGGKPEVKKSTPSTVSTSSKPPDSEVPNELPLQLRCVDTSQNGAYLRALLLALPRLSVWTPLKTALIFVRFSSLYHASVCGHLSKRRLSSRASPRFTAPQCADISLNGAYLRALLLTLPRLSVRTSLKTLVVGEDSMPKPTKNTKPNVESDRGTLIMDGSHNVYPERMYPSDQVYKNTYTGDEHICTPTSMVIASVLTLLFFNVGLVAGFIFFYRVRKKQWKKANSLESNFSTIPIPEVLFRSVYDRLPPNPTFATLGSQLST